VLEFLLCVIILAAGICAVVFIGCALILILPYLLAIAAAALLGYAFLWATMGPGAELTTPQFWLALYVCVLAGCAIYRFGAWLRDRPAPG
jgi:hypothetical protein